MKKSLLHSQYESLNVSFKEYHGWLLPEYFSSTQEEWRAVHSGVGGIDFSHLGKISVRGKDRTAFLHNMLSNDIQSLKPGSHCYAALLTPKGKMISDLHVFAFENYFLIALNEGLVQTVIEKLSSFIISEDVVFQDSSSSFGLLSIQGPESGKFLKNFPTESFNVKVFPNPRCTEEGYDLFVPIENLAGLWSALTTAQKMIPVGQAAYDILRIEAGIPLFGQDMDENTIPNEALLEKAVSWTKGCYPGQEVVARIKYRGGVTKMLSGLLISENKEPPPVGSKIFKNSELVGNVTSSCYSFALKSSIAMSLIKKIAAENGTSIQIEHQGKQWPAKIKNLPFCSRNLK